MKGTTALSLNNVLNRQMLPVLSVWIECGKGRDGQDDHKFERPTNCATRVQRILQALCNKRF
jgi:hypothetical protein